MVHYEGHGVEVWECVVDGLAADVAGWLVAGYACAVLVPRRCVPLHWPSGGDVLGGSALVLLG